jgi:hypothetical protein
MPGELQVDFEDVHRAGAGIASSAQALRAKVQSFQAELQGFGQPWGNDDIGSLIGMCYQAIYEAAMECFADNIGELAGQAEGVQAMAATYREAEDASAIEVNRVRDILG